MKFLAVLTLILFGIHFTEGQEISGKSEDPSKSFDSYPLKTERFDDHGDFLYLRHDVLIRKSSIEGIVSNQNKVEVLLKSGRKLIISPEDQCLKPVQIHEALRLIITTSQRKYRDLPTEVYSDIWHKVATAKDVNSVSFLQKMLYMSSSWENLSFFCEFSVTEN